MRIDGLSFDDFKRPSNDALAPLIKASAERLSPLMPEVSRGDWDAELDGIVDVLVSDGLLDEAIAKVFRPSVGYHLGLALNQ